MPKNPLASIWFRLKFLLDGKAEWIGDNGNVEVTQEDWRTRWAIAGIHSNNWRWVRHWGKMECGCTRNPLTRRIVLYMAGCNSHCFISFSDEATTQ
jgi:hypothetical protein